MSIQTTSARGWSYAASIPYEKPSSLDDLRGPTEGIVTVSPRISSAPQRTFNLADPGMRRWLYEQTVRDGLAREQVAILNRAWLLNLWSELNLPARCRAEWELAFPELVLA